MQECLDQRAAIANAKEQHVLTDLPTPGLNIAFTFSGLQKLGVGGLPAGPILETLKNGMHASQSKLNDPPSSSWRILKPSSHLHGVFIVTGATHAEVVDVISLRLATAADNGWQLRHEEVGQIRPFPVKGHEHFGF